MLEKWGTSQIIDMFSKTGKVGLKEALKKTGVFQAFYNIGKGIAVPGGKEGIQEGSQQIVGNLVDKMYKLDRGVMDGVLESMALGAIGGAGMGVAPSVITEIQRDKYHKTLKDGFGLSDQEINLLYKEVERVIKEDLKPEQLKEALGMIKDSDMFDSTPQPTKELIDNLSQKMGIPEAVKMVKNMTEEEIRTVKQQVKEIDTEESNIRYTKYISERESEMENMGWTPELIQSNMQILDVAITTLAVEHNVPRGDIASEMIAKIEKAGKDQNQQFTEGMQYNQQGEIVQNEKFNSNIYKQEDTKGLLVIEASKYRELEEFKALGFEKI